MILETKINQIPDYILQILPDFFIEELKAYEEACRDKKPNHVKKDRLVDISASLKVIELSKKYPQSYIDTLWTIYPIL